jgi:hypothetical protein
MTWHNSHNDKKDPEYNEWINKWCTSIKPIIDTTGQVVGLLVSILRVMGSYPTQVDQYVCTGKSQSLWDRVVG